MKKRAWGIFLGLALMSIQALCITASAGEPQYAEASNVLQVPDEEIIDLGTIEDEPDVAFEGALMKKGQSQSYTYTAPRNGRYHISAEDVKTNCVVKISISDSWGNDVSPNYNGMVEFDEGETYTINVSQYTGFTRYTVRIIVQKPATVFETAEIQLKDSLRFEDQKNVYYYTPEISGKYHFTLTEDSSASDFEVLGWDSNDTNLENDDGTFDLDAGTTYQFQVRADYNGGIGSYTLKFEGQKKRIDITGYTEIKDNITFSDQRNYYDFIAPVSGTYEITMTEDSSGTELGCVFKDTASDYEFWNYTGSGLYAESSHSVTKTAELTEGQNYRLLVAQWGDAGVGSYTVDIHYPSEAQNYLDEFAAGISEEAGDSEASEEETEEIDLTHLESDYKQLQSDYNELKEQYDNLESKYNLLIAVLNDANIEIETE